MSRVSRKHAEVPKSFKGELERKTLLKRLRGTHEARVIALLAPAGYGKTTLLSQLARASSSTVAWVSLLADDADTTRLIASTVEALERALPGAFCDVQKLLAQPVSPEALTRALVQDLAQLDSNLTIVFDKAERLGALGGNWLNDLVQRLPEGHQIWIAGYASAPLPMARWVADGFAVMLSDGDLAFSELESAAMLRQHIASNTVSNESLQALKGWPAAVSLLARGAVTAFVQPRDLLSQGVERLPQAIRKSVEELSTCEVWDAALPARLGVELPVGWLDALLETGLPLTRLSDGRFAPHSLLLDALRERLEQDAPRFKAACCRSAALKEKDGQTINALKLYILGNCTADASRVLDLILPDLMNRYEYALVLELVQLVAESDKSPRAWVYQGLALIGVGDSISGTKLLKLHMHGSGDEAQAYCNLSLEFYMAGDYLKVLELLDEGESFVRSEADALRLGLRRLHALRELGREERRLERCLELREIAERHGDPYLLASTFDVLAGEYLRMGNNTLAEMSFRRSLQVLQAAGAERRTMSTLADFSNALILWDRSAEAMELIEIGMQIVGASTPFWEMAFLGSKGLAAYVNAEFDEAEVSLRACLDICTRHSFDSFAVPKWLHLSQLHSLTGQLEKAAKCLDQAETLSKTGFVDAGEAKFTRGILSFVGKQYLEANALFTEALNDPLLMPWGGLRAMGYLAQLALHSGTLNPSHATSLMDWKYKVGHSKPLLVDLEFVEPALHHLIAQGWLTLDIEALKASSIRVGDAKPELFVQAMSVSSIEINGLRVRPRLKRCFELLVWLCVHGSGTKEQIVDALWDGSRNRSHADHFKVIVRNLRADLVGQGNLVFNPIEFDGERYRVSKTFKLRTDFPTSSEAVAQTNPSAIGERAVFMDGIYTNWVADYRLGLEAGTLDESPPIRLESANKSL